MHKAALKHFALAGDYQLFDIAPATNSTQGSVQDAIKAIIETAKKNPQTKIGLNVTVPHKEVALQFVGELTAEAKLVNAVNCLKVSDTGEVIGHNTDLDGFIKSARELFGHAPNEFACVLGTGGAAKAAVIGLSKIGYKQIAIVFRNKHKATTLRSYFTKLFPQVKFQMIDCQDLIPLANCQLMVNATSIGLTKDNLPDWVEKFFASLPDNFFFYDMVYRKDGSPTRLMELAQKRNLKVCDGIDMLVNQAVRSFSFWTNYDCPKSIMHDALNQAQIS